MPFTTTSNYLHTSYLQHTATRRVTWPTTVSSSPTPVSDNCVLPTLKHLLSVGRAAVWETWTFATAGPQVWNSLPPSLRVCGLSYGPVQTVIEDIFIRTVRPWHSVNCFSLCRTKIILLTYLHCWPELMLRSFMIYVWWQPCHVPRHRLMPLWLFTARFAAILNN